MEVVSFSAKSRESVGTTGSRRTRKEGLIPAVMYGGEEVKHFTVEKNQVKSLIYTPEFKMAEVEIDGATHKCILKSIQMHPITDNLIHLDFLQLIDGKPVKCEIPVKFTGTAPGVKEGGKFQQLVRRVKVKTNPENLVNELMVDISELELGGSVRIKDITESAGIEIMSSPNIPVASVIVPRAAKVEETAEAVPGAEGEAAEGADAAAAPAEGAEGK